MGKNGMKKSALDDEWDEEYKSLTMTGPEKEPVFYTTTITIQANLDAAGLKALLAMLPGRRVENTKRAPLR